MLDAVTQGAPQPGDQAHTFIKLAPECLAYQYTRDTVTIYGNVVEATHGATRNEVLGGGDASKALQTFTLKQSPLTFVSAATVSGVDTTLQVRVNDVQWHEAASLAALGPKDRKFLTRTDNDAKASVVFGDGERGARLPTGVENVKATYRNGIGKPGNVKAGQITLLGTRPLGVKEVTNPLRASGGADSDSRDQARQNVPIALLALDRLVSVSDYADFSRTFAGIGKAASWHDTDGQHQLVRVVIAGADDIPIDQSSDLYRNLYAALHQFGDPYLPIAVAVRERLTLVISANVKVDPDYQWETLEPNVRAALLDRFSFARMDLGENVFLSDAIDAVQAVRGVVYVDVDVFATIEEATLSDGFTHQTALALGRSDRIPVTRGQIAYLVAEVPDTLILQEIKT
jgi:predicted phage baseplate assembly protein